jgi:hypothetical protein
MRVRVSLDFDILTESFISLCGTRSEGLIDGCDLVFLTKSKDGDYHQEMNSFVFFEWFEKIIYTWSYRTLRLSPIYTPRKQSFGGGGI